MVFGTSNMKIDFSLLKSVFMYPYRCYKRRYYKKNMKKFGMSSWIEKPLRLQGLQNISIGENVGVHHRSWLAALPLTGKEVSLIINDGCTIGDYNHIFATHRIEIEKDVLTANHVYISDNLHDYNNLNVPIIKQPIVQKSIVVIGEGSWIGENVCIIGACIGKHCVIGANSVVTKDIPDYSIAVGIPARVIKRYDFKENKWVKCK